MQKTPSSPQKATGERLDMPRKSEVSRTLRRTAPVETDLEIIKILGLADKKPNAAIKTWPRA